MITFEISINDSFVTRAGRSDLCVLGASISTVGVLGPDSAGANKKQDTNDLYVHVGGLTSKKDGSKDEHLTWVAHRELVVGDEVKVKIVESAEADLPVKEPTPVDEEARERSAREMYESAKHYYLEHRSKYEPNVG